MGNKTIFGILYFFIVFLSSAKSKPESSFPIKIVQIFSQNVFIAAIVDSGVVAIASSIKVIHLKVHIFSCLWESQLNSFKTFFIISIFFL